jgi:integrase
VPEAPVKVATEFYYRRLLAACPKSNPNRRRDAAIFGLLWWGGFRRGELVVLDVADVDLDVGVLTIPRTKGGTPRRVP